MLAPGVAGGARRAGRGAATLPHARVRSNSLDVVGDTMVVAYQTRDLGGTPAGFEMFDVSDPESPRSIGFFDCSGPHSRGVHMVWFVDGEYVHMSSGAPDFEPHDERDDQRHTITLQTESP
mgnify:CR=1 FL=1